MKCKITKNNFIKYYEGSLPENDYVFVAKHLEECKSCSRIAEEFNTIYNMTTKEDNVKLADDFWTRLEVNISKNDQVQVNVRYRNSSIVGIVKQSGIAALFVFGIFYGYNLGSLYSLSIESGKNGQGEEYLNTFDSLDKGTFVEVFHNFYTNRN